MQQSGITTERPWSYPLFSSRLIPLIPQAVYRSLVLSQYFGMPVQAIFQKGADPGKNIKGKQKT